MALAGLSKHLYLMAYAKGTEPEVVEKLAAPAEGVFALAAAVVVAEEVGDVVDEQVVA